MDWSDDGLRDDSALEDPFDEDDDYSFGVEQATLRGEGDPRHTCGAGSRYGQQDLNIDPWTPATVSSSEEYRRQARGNAAFGNIIEMVGLGGSSSSSRRPSPSQAFAAAASFVCGNARSVRVFSASSRSGRVCTLSLLGTITLEL